MGFGKNNTGVIIRDNSAIALSTLGGESAIVVTTDVVWGEDFRALKTEFFALVEGLTGGQGSGLLIGIADGELTATEIEECLQADGPGDRNDNAPKERAERPVWLIGAVVPGNTSADELRFIGAGGSTLMEWKKRWTFSNPEGMEFFIYNQSGVALTTGATVRIDATHYGVWLS